MSNKLEDSKQQVYKTYDYDRFSLLSGNRAINRAHVKNLILSISENNLLHKNPILVDKHFAIVDGQHRWAAAKQVGEALYYVIADKAGLHEVRLLNAYTVQWKLNDFLLSFINEGNADYIKIKDFRDKYGFSVSTALGLLSGHEFTVGNGLSGGDNSRRISDLTSELKAGIFKVTHGEQAIEFAEFLLKLRNYTDPNVFKGRDFITAVQHTLRLGSISELGLLESFQKLEQPMRRQPTVKDYLRDFESMLNKHRRNDKIRLF